MSPSTDPLIGDTTRVVTVMVVDDQRAARMGLSLIINRADDLEVIAQATHGQDALDQLANLSATHHPLPDVALMDIRMPVLNGVDAIARIAQLHPSVKTLALTTYDQDDYAFGALSAGASGFLLKDTRTAQLHQAIRAVASGDAILTPRITRELLKRHSFRPVTSPQQRSARERLERLSPREREVAELVAQGLTNSEIAQRLVIATDSVKKNVTRILSKLGLRDRVQLVILMRDIDSR
ncbi:response regulator transcription factor [Actinomyces sp.]|uniref:response regulator transcription factor n=1 Tax=Actinomyces sp. TaxID=29317 RepID=UPI0026DD7434|nr:response regulator transcription factor [Actinomyces sp.]MDO4900033.1 response regulator transcription factor [Actinomyces sp.]